MHALGRPDDAPFASGDADPPTAHLGWYRAQDGSDGARVGLDLDRPHAALVVGKRGYGKSYTLGVLAEAAARTPGVAPVVLDPMGVFTGLARASEPESPETDAVPARVVSTPRVRAGALPPPAWPSLLGLDAESAAGALVWRAATESETLAAMREHVTVAEADDAVRLAAANHLRLADAWDVFAPDGLTPVSLADGPATVLDLSGLDARPMNALARVVLQGLYQARASGDIPRLPWLFVDEAHVFTDGLAAPAFRTVLTRGRAPGISLVAATQRPSALPAVALSQADLLLAHRLTAETDIEALAAASPTYLRGSLRERLPSRPGDLVVLDDVTESVHGIRVRERVTEHGGASPRASTWRERAGDTTPQSI